jgi:hypothetical protein
MQTSHGSAARLCPWQLYTTEKTYNLVTQTEIEGDKRQGASEIPSAPTSMSGGKIPKASVPWFPDGITGVAFKRLLLALCHQYADPFAINAHGVLQGLVVLAGVYPN